MIVQSLFIKSNQIDIFISVNNFIGTMTEGGGCGLRKKFIDGADEPKTALVTREKFIFCVFLLVVMMKLSRPRCGRAKTKIHSKK